jgi:hypothetical protein
MLNKIKEKIKNMKPDSYSRSLKLDPEIWPWIISQWSFNFIPNKDIQYIHWVLTNESPLCEHDSQKRFISYTKGYQSVARKCNKCKDITNEKRKITTLESYGVDHISQLDVTKEKRKQTCLQNFGVDSYSKTDEHRQKIKQYLHTRDVEQKIKTTNTEKWGHEYAIASTNVRNKIKNTNIERWGHEHHMQNTILQSQHSDIFKEKALNKDLGVYSHISEESMQILYNKQKFIDFVETGIEKREIHVELGVGEDLINKLYNLYSIEFPKQSQSYYEIIIIDFFHSENMIYNSRTIIPPYEIDIYFPDYNLAVEINGNYWHSELNGKDNRYHYNKYKLCKQKNIQLIQIFEDEIVNKKDIIYSMMRAKMNKVNTVMARQCKIITSTSTNDVRKFMNENHIQGECNSSINISLIHNDAIVAMGSFSKSRYKKTENVYELTRFCSKQNTNVVGGFSKIISYFKKMNICDYLISYSDNRYSNGNVYQKNGFKKISENKPSFYVMDKKNYLVRHNRLKFQKHKLNINENITAWDYLKENGYDRIWDCGTITWKLNF